MTEWLKYTNRKMARDPLFGMTREPLIHSHITNRLPDDHPLANSNVRCVRCEQLLHKADNKCMQTWIETENGNFCPRHFPLRPVLG